MKQRIAESLLAAELLKLRRRRALQVWTSVLLIGSMVLVYGMLLILHANDPVAHGPAGGTSNFDRALDVLTLAGIVCAAMVGTTAGAGDLGSGIFRDLVATGRSRLHLYAVRLPAAVISLVPVVAVGFAIAVAATVTFAGDLSTPAAGAFARGLIYVEVATALTAIVAIGLAELVGSRGIAIGVLLGWVLAGQTILEQIDFLGRSRQGLMSIALERLRPTFTRGPLMVPTSLAIACSVIAAWMLVLSGAGAWRASSRDA